MEQNTTTCSASLIILQKEAKVSLNQYYSPSAGQQPLSCKCNLSSLLLKSHKCCETVKFKVINQWVIQNGFPFDQVAVFDLLKQLKFKDLQDCGIKKITTEVSSWNISEEQLSIFNDMVDEAKKERDAENEMRKRMRHNEKIVYKRGIHLRIQRHFGLGIGFGQNIHMIHHDPLQNGIIHQLENQPPQGAAGPAIAPPLDLPPALLQELDEEEMINVEMLGLF